MSSELFGLDAIDRQLSALELKVGGKALRSAALRATTKTLRKLKTRAPRGTEAHRTYKGRLVAPGFASRSLRRKTKLKNGRVSVVIGVLAEAFYAIQFYDLGPYTISERRVSIGKRRRVKKKIKSYTLPKRPWFRRTFIEDRRLIESELVRILKQNITKAVKS
jgi:hypothetical protein